MTVYSNQPEVELFADGKSLGKQSSPEHFFYFEVPNAGETTLKAVAGECTDKSFIRKVEVFNEAYRLKEKGAVLNWFDITEPEGYFSLNSRMGDILATEQGGAWLGKTMAQLMPKKEDGGNQGFEMNEGMMKMLGGFTVLRMLNMLGMAMKDAPKLTKEQLLDMNAQLNQIKKPE